MAFVFTIEFIKKLKFFAVSLVFFKVICQTAVLANEHKNLLANSTPAFNNGSYSFSISDQIAPGNSAGAVAATDPDGDALTYSIKSGNTNSAFSINSSTGSISVAKRLNHHTQDVYKLVVKATDPGQLSTEVSVTIAVADGSANPGTGAISWGTAASQPYTVNESQGEVVNGKLYTFGGFDSQKSGFTPTSRAYVFDPAANNWKSIAAMPAMNGTGHGGVTHAGFTTDGTDIYFAGGYTSNSSGTGQIFGTKEVWKYIVAENRYVRMPDLPIVIAAGQLEYLAGKLHYISGTNAARTTDLGNHYVLDLDNLGAGWQTLASLPNPRQHAGSVVYENKIYFIGGQHGQDEKLVAQKEVHRYDPNTNTWTKLADLPVPSGATGRGHISSATIVRGKYVVVVAGETVHNTGRTNMVSAYDAATNTWQNLTALPQTRYSGVAANLGGLIYYTGGSKTSTTYKENGSSSSTAQTIQDFTLINADNDQPIATLSNGDVLNLATLPSTHLNILATTNPSKIGSVQFNLTGTQTRSTVESGWPYTLFGDDGNGDYYSWTPTVGNYTLKATPFTSSGAKGTAGTSKTVSFSVTNNGGQQQNITLLSTADAYVRGGSYASTNFGTAGTLTLKGSPSADFSRFAYLKFSLASVSSIGSATLRLYGNATSGASLPISVYSVNTDSWSETGITFANAPAPSTTALSSTNITDVTKYYDFDVTAFVKAQLTGDKTVSLLVKDPKNSDLNLTFYSRENSVNAPQLLIGYNTLSKKTPGNANIEESNAVFYPEISKDLALPSTLSLGKKIKVYPNPMHKTFTIEFAKDVKGSYDLHIVDPVGRIYELGKSQLKPGGYSTEIDISKLSLNTGVYYLRVRSGNHQAEIIKLIIE